MDQKTQGLRVLWNPQPQNEKGEVQTVVSNSGPKPLNVGDVVPLRAIEKTDFVEFEDVEDGKANLGTVYIKYRVVLDGQTWTYQVFRLGLNHARLVAKGEMPPIRWFEKTKGSKGKNVQVQVDKSTLLTDVGGILE